MSTPRRAGRKLKRGRGRPRKPIDRAAIVDDALRRFIWSNFRVRLGSRHGLANNDRE
jgi:hypothetical protein